MIKQLRIAVIVTVLMMVGTGLVYPLVMTGLAKVVFPNQANGSLIKKDGVTIGSSLIGQSFVDPNTDLTLPGYFRSRPSAAGAGYDAGVSSGSNLGPTNQVLIDRVTADVAAIRTENGLAANATIPVDLVTTSGSGLDPAISPAAAEIQVARVAKQRGLTEDQVRAAVKNATSGRTLWVFGEERVNVLELNLALGAMKPMPAPIVSPAASPAATPAA